MTVANRAVGAPFNIWNDHRQHEHARRGLAADFAEPIRKRLSLHIQAFKIAEELSHR